MFSSLSSLYFVAGHAVTPWLGESLPSFAVLLNRRIGVKLGRLVCPLEVPILIFLRSFPIILWIFFLPSIFVVSLLRSSFAFVVTSCRPNPYQLHWVISRVLCPLHVMDRPITLAESVISMVPSYLLSSLVVVCTPC